MISFFTKTTDMMTSKKRWTALVVLAVSLFVVTMDMTILIMASKRVRAFWYPTVMDS